MTISLPALWTSVARNISLIGSAVLVHLNRAYSVVVLGCVVLSMAAAGATEQEDKVPKQVFQCGSCGKGVQRGYIQAMGKVWHPEHFVCEICNKNLQGASFIPHEGRPYHQHCYLDQYAPRCAGCDQPIEGSHLTAIDQQWHPHHFICATCEQPIIGSKFVENAGHPYHESCSAKTFNPRCEICLAPVTEHYLTNFWQEAFCQHHSEQLEQCYGCGRLVSEDLTSNGVRFEDGRTMCNLCRRTGIDSLHAAKKLAQKVATEISDMDFRLSRTSFPLRLVDRLELSRAGTHGERINGTTRMAIETLNGEEVSREISTILMLHGLPAESFAATYAHELGHVWLFEQHFPELPLQVEEGLCELLAHLWLINNPSPWSDYLIHLKERSTDPVYGEGYRIALRSLNHLNPAELFEYVKKYQRFPNAPNSGHTTAPRHKPGAIFKPD